MWKMLGRGAAVAAAAIVLGVVVTTGQPDTAAAKRPKPTPTPTASPTPSGAAPSWNPGGAYISTFDDEFDDTTVDTSKWETGWFGTGITNSVNSDNLNCYDTAQVTETGGYLHLTVAQRTATCNGTTKQYVSGLVNTRNSFNQQYGSFEARVCLPDVNSDGQVDGFPAWWTNGPASVAWPAHGEIDTVEGLGGQTAAHLHYTNDGGGPGWYSTTPYTGCHLFGHTWAGGTVTFYWDSVPVWIHTFDGPYPQYLILNYALSTHGAVIVGSEVQVDWVRAWQ